MSPQADEKKESTGPTHSRARGAVTQTLREAVHTELPPDVALPTESGLTAFLGSPRAIMVVIPFLVLFVGAALTLIGQTALTATSKKMAERGFVTQASALSLRLTSTLTQAEPILGELSRIAQGEAKRKTLEDTKSVDASPPTTLNPLAREMSSLLVGRPGITQAYIAFPNGLFLSAAHGAKDGARFEVTQKGLITNYHLTEDKLLKGRSQPTQYDPTTRAWYQLAVQEKARVWSEPYAFYLNYRVGVTRAMPIYRDTEKTQLLAVVGVDFDVDALTDFMGEGESPTSDVRSLVFTLGGVILAYPAGAKKIASLPRSEKVPTHEALGDERVSRLIEYSQEKRASAASGKSFYYRDQGDAIFASLKKVGAGGPDWYVATFSPRRAVLSELYSHRKTSLIVGGIALLLSVALAWFVARRILQVRKAASLAQAAVVEAQEHIRDLGSYRLVSLIGEGGMGEVWRAKHRLLAREAAIKLIKQDASSSSRKAEHRERFRREALAIARLRSRNTVALFDYGVTNDGTLFYVMELLDGIDLNTLVSKHGPQPAERIRNILIQACNSLSEAHEAGLIHRDIKPANLVLCREAHDVDVVKVLDFGLVFQTGGPEASERGTINLDSQQTTWDGSDAPKASPEDQGRITHFEHQLGTPAFMSPEQATGLHLDARSDIYSLGCVAWWLLSGKPPYRADSALALMVKHADAPLPDFEAELSEPAPKQLLDVIKQCLQKSTADRPQSAAALRTQLQEMGKISPSWSDSDAHGWWAEVMPQTTHDTQHSLPPLRDTELIAPKKAS